MHLADTDEYHTAKVLIRNHKTTFYFMYQACSHLFRYRKPLKLQVIDAHESTAQPGPADACGK